MEENTAGAPPGDLSSAGETEAQRRGKAQWASKTEAEKEEHRRKVSEGVKRAAAKRKAKERGERDADDAPRAKGGARASGQAAGETKTAELIAIREGLTMVLCAPSMVGSAKGDPWLTDHFLQRGPALAQAITDEAARNDQFRAYLVRIVGLMRGASLIGALAMYVGPVIMHMGAMPNLLGVPVVGERPAGAPPRAPHFMAPERGAAEVVDPLTPQERAEVDEAAAFLHDDGYAQEVGELRQNGGGFVPPLPMEPV